MGEGLIGGVQTPLCSLAASGPADTGTLRVAFCLALNRVWFRIGVKQNSGVVVASAFFVILFSESSHMNTSTAVFLRSAPDLESCPDDDLLEFAFAGRSNVGKSSLLNMLVGKRDLAKVSATPGHTKHLNFFNIDRRWRLVDLPGYGFAEVARKDKARFNQGVSDYLVNRTNLVCVFALVDSTLPPQKIDLEFLEWLVDNEVPFVLVFTKTDKVSATKVQTNIAALKERLSQWCEKLPEIITCSSVERRGRKELLEVIEQALKADLAQAEDEPEPTSAETTERD